LEGEDDQSYETSHFLKPQRFIFSASVVSSITRDTDLANRIRTALPKDESLGPCLKYLENSNLPRPAEIAKKLQEYTMVDGVVLFRDLIYVPNDTSIKLTIRARQIADRVESLWGLGNTWILLSGIGEVKSLNFGEQGYSGYDTGITHWIPGIALTVANTQTCNSILSGGSVTRSLLEYSRCRRRKVTYEELKIDCDIFACCQIEVHTTSCFINIYKMAQPIM
jgi:hypothetical protein